MADKANATPSCHDVSAMKGGVGRSNGYIPPPPHRHYVSTGIIIKTPESVV